MGTSSKAVTQPSYSDQLNTNLNAQVGIAPKILSAEQMFAPQQTALVGQLQNQAYGQGINQISQFAPQLQNLATQGQLQAIQGNPLYSGLYNTALQQVGAGGGLTPDQQIQATQAAQQGLAQSGRANSNQSIFNQILGRTQFSNQNLQQHLSNANMAMSGLPNQGTGYANAVNGMLPGSQSAIGGLSNLSFNPESNYAANIQDSNQSSQQAANNANANMSNGILGGVLGGVGSILGGPIGGSLFAGLSQGSPQQSQSYMPQTYGSSNYYNGGGFNNSMNASGLNSPF